MAAYPKETYREILTRLNGTVAALTSHPNIQRYYAEYEGKSNLATAKNLQTMLTTMNEQLSPPYPSDPEFFTKLPNLPYRDVPQRRNENSIYDLISFINEDIEKLSLAHVDLVTKVREMTGPGGKRKRTRRKKSRRKSRR